MFYILILISMILFFNLYKKYFKINYLIFFGYLVFIPIIMIIYYLDNIITAVFLLYIYSFLYLSMITDLKEKWIADLTVIMVFILNSVKLLIGYFMYNQKLVLSGTIIMLSIILVILLIELIIKKEVMGFGDLKLFFVLSINFEIIWIMYLLIISSIIGIIYYYLYYKKENYFPFGPAIIISYLIIYILKTGLA